MVSTARACFHICPGTRHKTDVLLVSAVYPCRECQGPYVTHLLRARMVPSPPEHPGAWTLDPVRTRASAA